MAALRIVVLAGSSRAGSWNAKLADVAEQSLRRLGAVVVRIDLRALAMPIYDGDIEAGQGAPAGALSLRDAVADCDGLLVVSPEYNGFPTPLLINAFDWLSRVPASGDRPQGLAATAGKPAALLGASPGLLGALRSVNTLRQYLQMAFAMLVVPQQHALSRAHEAFDVQGALKDVKAAAAVDVVAAALVRVAGALRAAAS